MGKFWDTVTLAPPHQNNPWGVEGYYMPESTQKSESLGNRIKKYLEDQGFSVYDWGSFSQPSLSYSGDKAVEITRDVLFWEDVSNDSIKIEDIFQGFCYQFERLPQVFLSLDWVRGWKADPNQWIRNYSYAHRKLLDIVQRNPFVVLGLTRHSTEHPSDETSCVGVYVDHVATYFVNAELRFGMHDETKLPLVVALEWLTQVGYRLQSVTNDFVVLTR